MCLVVKQSLGPLNTQTALALNCRISSVCNTYFVDIIPHDPEL